VHPVTSSLIPFDAVLPADPVTPVVVSVPHAGVEVAHFAPALAPSLDVRCDADLFVDELYAGSPRGAFIHANLSRFVCDLNRDAEDVSPRTVPSHPTARNLDGRGFIWEVTTRGAPALARPLSLEEWLERQAIHAQYHQTIASALERARARFGYAILVDGHSMPSVGHMGHADPGRPRADIVPGDRVGQSCSPALSQLVGDFFRSHNFSVAFNEPYRGGFITAHHGKPAAGVHAIQIEMRRDLYMNETTFARVPEKMQRLKTVLHDLLRALDAFDPRGAT
jgi:N-formylglutamate deformylase